MSAPAHHSPVPDSPALYLEQIKLWTIDAGVALSLANLCFINVWTELLDSATANFFAKTPLPSSSLRITAANISLVTLVLFVAMSIARRLHGRVRAVAEVIWICALIVPLNIVRTQILGVGAKDWHFLLVMALLLTGFGLALAYRRKAVRTLRVLLLVLLPFFPLACGRVILDRTVGMPNLEEFNRVLLLPLVRPNEPRSVRIVWMIFDEFDECMAFPRRSPDLRLPALDRLQAESLYAVRAVSPQSNTIRSIPSLLTGKVVERSQVSSISELQLTYRSSRGYHFWSREPNVFSRAYHLGFNSGVAGWFLPYCRLFPLASCDWEPMQSVMIREHVEAFAPFPKAMWQQLSQQLVEVPGFRLMDSAVGRAAWANSPKARRASRESAIQEYTRVYDYATALLRRRDIDLAYFHWPTPHPLTYFDRRTGDFSVADGPNYFDALALVDKTVAQVRGLLEREGAWDNTVLVVSSDHPLRADVLRDAGFWSKEEARALPAAACSYIPFILKMPGQREAVRYDRQFHTVVTGDLLLAILRGEVKTAPDAAQWLDSHGR